MHAPEAKKKGQEFLTGLLNSNITPHTIGEIILLLEDKNVEQESEYLDLLEATKDCKTDEEFLAAVRAVLQKEDDS